MLILNRKSGKKILIGKDVVVTALGYCAKTKQVKIGIDAPVDVRVLREEIADRYVVKQDEPKK